MTIFNLGSINIDYIYKLPHFPFRGETVPSIDYDIGLGGKGINQSIAAVNAGGTVVEVANAAGGVSEAVATAKAIVMAVALG